MDGASLTALKFAAALSAKVIITPFSDLKLAKVKGIVAPYPNNTTNYATTSNWEVEVESEW
jgi:hypothetical protein